MTFAVRGRCSLTCRPGTDVGIGLNSPPSRVPGFMSKVSLCDGPPSIHRRMHALCLAFVWAAWVASTLSQPDIEVAATPAADSLSRSRRERLLGFVMGGFSRVWRAGSLFFLPSPPRGEGSRRAARWGVRLSVVQRKFAAVEQGPQDVAVGLR